MRERWPHGESDGDLSRLLAQRRLACREHAELGTSWSSQDLQCRLGHFTDRNLVCRQREERAATAARQGRGWSLRASGSGQGEGSGWGRGCEALAPAAEMQGRGRPSAPAAGGSRADIGSLREWDSEDWRRRVSDLAFFISFLSTGLSDICSSNCFTYIATWLHLPCTDYISFIFLFT
jgi:hypothetical protein